MNLTTTGRVLKNGVRLRFRPTPGRIKAIVQRENGCLTPLFSTLLVAGTMPKQRRRG
jgi:hypothetical protein